MTNLLQINQHIYIDQSQLLGKGSTGNVYLGRTYKDDNQLFAVKAIDLSQVNNEVTQYLLSCQIVALSQLAKLNIQHVVKLHQVAFSQGYCYLAMELLQGGSLAEHIRQNPNGIQEKQVQSLFRQLFQGYKAIRNLGIVHRDIKPDNIIFRYKQSPNGQPSQKQLCYIDFGYCTKQSVPNRPQVYYNVGSPKYMSPQAFKKNKYSEKSDMWALGIILYEMLHGRTIDRDMDMEEYMKFMQHNQIPFARNVNGFLRNLVCGLLTFDVNKRISCDIIDQMLNGNHHQNTQQVVSSHKIQHQNQQNQQFTQFIPQLEISSQGINKRNSNFFSSQIITHRSDPSETINHFHSHHHPRNQVFQPRRQQRNFSQENDLHEFSQSPKKVIHLDHTIQKANLILTNGPFDGEKRQVVEKFRQFEQRNFSKQFFNGPVGPVRRHLEKIEQQHDNEVSRQNLIRMNNTAQNFRVQPDIKRSFLKTMDQGQLQTKVEISSNPQIINNPNVRFLNNSNNNLPVNQIPQGSRPQQLVRSQIFPQNADKRFDSGTNFYSSQINSSPLNQLLNNNIKGVTSDKTINNRSFEHPEGQTFVRNLNKSYSTNNVGLKLESLVDNQTALVHSRFVSYPFNSNGGHQQQPHQPQQVQVFHNKQATLNNNLRPIDLLLQNKQAVNNRAFLRNTMPNVYRSSIDPINYGLSKQAPIQQSIPIQNLQNSKDLKKGQPTIIEQVNHSNFKKHSNYFDPNFITPHKQNVIQKNMNLTQFKVPHPFTVIQNRNQKSHSFKLIEDNQQNHTMQRGRTLINLLQMNQSQSPMNQQLQFKQHSAEIIQQKHAQINLVRPQPVQVQGQNMQKINQANQTNQVIQLIPMGQIQSKNVVFSNIEQRNVIAQNQIHHNHQHPQQQQNFQMLNLQQPLRNPQNQFRKSAIINISQSSNQQHPPMQISQNNRNVTYPQQQQPLQQQNQNMSYQQPRQSLVIDKPFYSQVSQPQPPRQILVNTINHNPEINKFIRPTYPLGNQLPITVTQF